MQANPVKCSSCGAYVHPLELFPGDKCLPCHGAQDAIAVHVMTGADLARMFGGK